MSASEFNAARAPQNHIDKDARQMRHQRARTQTEARGGAPLPVVKAASSSAGGPISQAELLRGNFIGRTSEDMQEDDRWDMYANAPGQLGEKLLPFKEYVEYVEKKRDRAAFQNYLGAAQLLMDPRRPETQANAYAIVPQLRTITEEDFRRELSTQIYLRHIVMNGHVGTKEEFDFLINTVLHPDFVLPSNALWDLNGAISAATPTTDPADKGLFMRYMWGGLEDMETAGALKVKEHPGLASDQLQMKTRIVQRCLPGLRDLKYTEAYDIVEAFSENFITNVPGTTKADKVFASLPAAAYTYPVFNQKASKADGYLAQFAGRPYKP